MLDGGWAEEINREGQSSDVKMPVSGVPLSAKCVSLESELAQRVWRQINDSIKLYLYSTFQTNRNAIQRTFKVKIHGK